MLHYLYEANYEDGSASSPFEITCTDNQDEILRQEESTKECRTSSIQKNSNTFEQGNRAHINAQMYVIADKYGITELKELAKEKFKLALESDWQDLTFISVVEFVYGPTSPTNSELRGVVTKFALQHLPVLKTQQQFHTVLKAYPDFAYDFLVLTMEKALPFQQQW